MIRVEANARVALRLNPPIPINTRTCIRDAVLPVGGGKDGLAPILVKKGDMVGYQVYSMHRQEKYFGSDPESFIPERWETIRPGWAYLPWVLMQLPCVLRANVA